MRIEPFHRSHAERAFKCGDPVLDSYLAKFAGQHQRRGIAATYVLMDDDTIAGYYTLSSTRVLLEQLPEDLARRLPKGTDLGATLIGRLAVASNYQGRGLGEALLGNAAVRALGAARTVASVALLVDPVGDPARRFYARFGFMPLRDDRGRMFLPLSTLEAGLAGKSSR